MPWTVDIYQPIFILGTWYKWQWHPDCPIVQPGFEDTHTYNEDDEYEYGVDATNTSPPANSENYRTASGVPVAE
jgi:hypothetical protein